ncbi:hypothetical protein [Mucilaginibacter gotjawali]|nr:hypothetical protein [Mucilaginibacter gotjawali]MBB3056114.1 hypothetical protein [Mucilaginibacter gotjawali]
MRSYILMLMAATGCFILAAGCTSTGHSRNKCGPCPLIAVQLPHMLFKVVDKTTGDNLFYGAGAPYKYSQLVMHHLVNGKPDSVVLRPDSTFNSFYMYINTVHNVDTVTMQIANLPQDIILFNTSNTGGCCSFLMLNSISYNGNVVFTSANGPNLVTLQK